MQLGEYQSSNHDVGGMSCTTKMSAPTHSPVQSHKKQRRATLTKSFFLCNLCQTDQKKGGDVYDKGFALEEDADRDGMYTAVPVPSWIFFEGGG
jgi:hypothetical protein